MKKYSFKPFKGNTRIFVLCFYSNSGKTNVFLVYTDESNIRDFYTYMFDNFNKDAGSFDIIDVVYIKEISKIETYFKLNS